MRKYFSPYAGMKRDVYVLAAARFINCLGSFINPLITLILTQKLLMSGAEAGRLVALLVITQGPCLAAGGKLADRFGRKIVFAVGCCLGAFFYLVCAFGASGQTMIFFLILSADMVALAIPAEDAMLADAAPESQRQPAFSLMYLAINMGMAVSPILGGILFLHHLQLLFLLDALTTLSCVAIIFIFIKETNPSSRKNEESGAEESKSSGAVLTKMTLFRALRKVPVLAVFFCLMFLFDFTYTQWNFLLPIQFGEAFGDDGARLYSYLCSANAVTVIVLAPVVTKMEKNLHPLFAIGISGLLYTAAYIGFGLQGPYIAYIFFGELFTIAEIWTAIRTGPFIYHYAPEECRARVAAFSNFMRGAAEALGPLLMGMLITVFDYRTGWFLTAVCILAGASGIFLLDRSVRRQEKAGTRPE